MGTSSKCLILVVLSGGCFLLGCRNNNARQFNPDPDDPGASTQLGRMKLPPAVAPPADVPIDPVLRDAARRELVEAATSSPDGFIRAHAIKGARDGLGRDARDLILR
ncbi:MAG: hypothetical protein ACREIT_11445, partial [Tepidisphaeraceae bacterium]